MSNRISVRDGAVYLPAEIVDRYFRGIDAVVVLLRGNELMILPVHQATSGGCLLKIRNAAGDRVAQARDVFQDQGLLDFTAKDQTVAWDSKRGALCATLNLQM